MTPVPTVAVGAIIFNEEGQVLLIQRGRPPGVGLWTLPGGKLALGETLAAAVEREVLEETGLVVRCGALVEVVERVIAAAPATGVYHYVILDYLATITAASADRAPCAGDDALAVAWVNQAQLATLPVTDGLAAVIERARDRANA